MSRKLFGRALLALGFVVAVSFGAYGATQAASMADVLAQGALNPQAPALLGPITSAGRKGWECKPERAAAATGSRGAELPPADSTPAP